MKMLEVRNLKKSFGDVQVLDGVSFSVERGEAVAVIGPSGGGKSTMLRCLIGLERADGGDILIEGEPLMENGVYVPDRRMRKVSAKMGMVFQAFNLFPHMTVLDNLTAAPIAVRGMAKKEALEQALERLHEVGLSEKAGVYPRALSGGQKQRVAIAGVIAMEPECIVLDEATAMLDPMGREEVLSTAHRLNREKGITVILITHHMNEAEEADRVIVMNDGHVAMDGSPQEVFCQVEKLRALGLTVPDTVELLYELRQSGWDVPLDALTVEACADAVAAAMK